MLLPVLMLIALLPRGYMPDSTALGRGMLTLTLCRVAQTMPDGTRTQAGDHGLVCPFGLLPAPLGPVEPLSLPVPLHWDWAPTVTVPALVRHVTVWAHGLGARGPPWL